MSTEHRAMCGSWDASAPRERTERLCAEVEIRTLTEESDARDEDGEGTPGAPERAAMEAAGLKCRRCKSWTARAEALLPWHTGVVCRCGTREADPARDVADPKWSVLRAVFSPEPKRPTPFGTPFTSKMLSRYLADHEPSFRAAAARSFAQEHPTEPVPSPPCPHGRRWPREEYCASCAGAQSSWPPRPGVWVAEYAEHAAHEWLRRSDLSAFAAFLRAGQCAEGPCALGSGCRFCREDAVVDLWVTDGTTRVRAPLCREHRAWAASVVRGRPVTGFASAAPWVAEYAGDPPRSGYCRHGVCRKNGICGQCGVLGSVVAVPDGAVVRTPPVTVKAADPWDCAALVDEVFERVSVDQTTGAVHPFDVTVYVEGVREDRCVWAERGAARVVRAGGEALVTGDVRLFHCTSVKGVRPRGASRMPERFAGPEWPVCPRCGRRHPR